MESAKLNVDGSAEDAIAGFRSTHGAKADDTPAGCINRALGAENRRRAGSGIGLRVWPQRGRLLAMVGS